MRVELPDPADDAALDELLTFAGTVGRPRAATATAYRAVASDATVIQPFVLRDPAGELVAAALATVSPSIGNDQVQLNGFLRPGLVPEFAAVLDSVATWAHARRAQCVTAHISDPDDAQLDAWRAARFEQVGERQRVIRTVGDDDHLAHGAIDGAQIVELRDHPELESGAEALWRQSHQDVPSALRFDTADLPLLREEIGLAPDEPFPTLVLVAVTAASDVVGLAVALRRYPGDRSVVGHRMTATERGWRNRGVALALKQELLRRGRTEGVVTFQASNDDGNAPMRAINERLGYQLDYRLVLMRRDL